MTEPAPALPKAAAGTAPTPSPEPNPGRLPALPIEPIKSGSSGNGRGSQPVPLTIHLLTIPAKGGPLAGDGHRLSGGKEVGALGARHRSIRRDRDLPERRDHQARGRPVHTQVPDPATARA